MLRMTPTALHLSQRDIEQFLTPEKDLASASDCFQTRLRAEADEFTPGRSRAGSAADAAGESFPTPSPHLDRYPLLLRPQGPRRVAGQASIRPPASSWYSPSFSSIESRQRNVSQLRSRVRQRAEHSRSDEAATIALRHEHSPLEELMNELSTLQDSFPAREDQRLERYRRADQSPASITISRVPRYDYPPHQGHHCRQQSHYQTTDLYQPPAMTPRQPSPACPATTETSARRRVQVYHDSSFSTQDIQEMETSRKPAQHRSVISQHETSGSQGPDRRIYRHTHPQQEASSHWQVHNAQVQPENDEFAQLGALVNVPVHAINMNTTPPARPRYEHFADPEY